MTPVYGGVRSEFGLSAKDGTGPSLAISWGQPASSAAAWKLDVYVRTDEGKVYVGTVFPLPPAAGPAFTPSRIVAEATVPGAREWLVEVIGPSGEQASIGLSTSPCCGLPGLADLDAAGRPNTAGATTLFSPPAGVAPSFVLSPRPSTLWETHGFQISGAVGYVQIFNAPALPANGSIPLDSIRVPDSAAWSWLVPTRRPLRLGLGIVVALSTTPGALTLAAGGLYAVGWID